MGFTLVLPLRIAQFVFALISMGLSAYVFHWYDSATLTDPPTQINFLIALPIFTFVSILYLEITPRFVPKISISYIHIALEVLNTILYFAGFVALSVFLSKLLFCRGKVCGAAQADAVFAALSFALWAASTTILALELFKGGIQGIKTDRAAAKAMDEQKKNNTEMKDETSV